MKLVIESDGTLKGTRVEFSMSADEVPRMLARKRRKKLKRSELAPAAPVIEGVWTSTCN